MNQTKVSRILKWAARITGTIVLLVPLITLLQAAMGDRTLQTDWDSLVLIFGLILGLSLAYKWELIGGALALIAILITGFIHPLIMLPPILYIVFWFVNRTRTIAST